MTDLTTLTDDQLRVKAAEAMGWKRDSLGFWGNGKIVTSPVGLPDPLHDLNDAVALAEKWKSQEDERYWLMQHFTDAPFSVSIATTQNGIKIQQTNASDDNSPARALTLAVLKAMEG